MKISNSNHLHISWFVGIVSLCFVIGVSLSGFLSYRLALLPGIISGVLLVLAQIKKYIALSILFAMLFGILFGIQYGSRYFNQLNLYEKYIGSQITATGVINGDPTISVDGDVVFRLRDVVLDGQNMPGYLWIDTSSNVELRRSYIVTIKGTLKEGFGSVPAAVYRATIVSTERESVEDTARDIRDTFSQGIRNVVKEPEASLAIGILVGQKTNLPEKLSNELQILGLTHIVVASGYNLTILVRFSRRLLHKISRFTAFIGALLLIFGFLQITGYSPSMNRAALVTGLSLVAWYFGRKIHPFVLLSLVAALTVLFEPSYAWGDVGWLLSFSSFIGIIILSPLVTAYFFGNNKPNQIVQIIIETLSAQILTVPIIMYVFEQYSPLSLLANVLVVPVISAVMLVSFMAGIGGMLIPAVSLVGLPAQYILMYVTYTTEKLSSLPYASREISLGAIAAVIYYLMCLVVFVYIKRRTAYMFSEYNIVE